MIHDFDSYALYEQRKRAILSVRIRVILTDAVDGEILRLAAEKAFRRFPYFARKVVLNDQSAYELKPCERPITVTPDDHIVRLGTPDTNNLLFAITYGGNDVFFNFSHNFCGAGGAMRWIKATLWQYLTDLGHEIDAAEIMTVDTPLDPAECAQPDIDALPTDEYMGDMSVPPDTFVPIAEMVAFMRNPKSIKRYYPISISKNKLLKYSRENDGSPNSILAALMFKLSTGAYPEETTLGGRIACSYHGDVGCPGTYRDMVRMLNIPYQIEMKDWPVEKLSTMTRGRMYLQMQPEISWDECRKLGALRNGIDALPDFDSKVDYAVAHSRYLNIAPATFTISYVGKVEWNGLAPYINGVYTLTTGHLILEVNATEEDFCISFQTYREDGKYLTEFLRLLDEERLPYKVGAFTERRLPEIVLPPRL